MALVGSRNISGRRPAGAGGLRRRPFKDIYLEEDLGDTTLFQFMLEERTGSEVPASVLAAYKKTLDWLPGFQMKAGKTLDLQILPPATVSTGNR